MIIILYNIFIFTLWKCSDKIYSHPLFLVQKWSLVLKRGSSADVIGLESGGRHLVGHWISVRCKAAWTLFPRPPNAFWASAWKKKKVSGCWLGPRAWSSLVEFDLHPLQDRCSRHSQGGLSAQSRTQTSCYPRAPEGAQELHSSVNTQKGSGSSTHSRWRTREE